MPSPRPDHVIHPERGEGLVLSGVTTPRDPAVLDQAIEPGTLFGATAPRGSITVDDGVLLLVGDVDSELVRIWDTQRPAQLDVQAVDARQVTFLGSPGLALLAGIAQTRQARLPLWASSRAVLRPLTVTGLDQLFDLHDPSA